MGPALTTATCLTGRINRLTVVYDMGRDCVTPPSTPWADRYCRWHGGATPLKTNETERELILKLLESQYFQQVTQNARQYDQDNAWFGFKTNGQVWSRGSWPSFIRAAWHLYSKACDNQLGMFILGDTKIRSDEDLVMNFGLVSNAPTPQEEADRQLIERLNAKRAVLATDSIFRPGNILNRDGASGGILSAKQWSPLLNDSFMLGGITSGAEFHLGLNEDETKEYKNIEDKFTSRGKLREPDLIGKTEFDKRRAAYGAPNIKIKARSTEQELWREFFIKVPRVFWNDNMPRVFVRELLGLQLFGYKPEFHLNQLSFKPPAGASTQIADFNAYLQHLHRLGFHDKDRVQLMSAISTFLFEDEEVLRGIGT